jgi:subtilisin family serine protease
MYKKFMKFLVFSFLMPIFQGVLIYSSDSKAINFDTNEVFKNIKTKNEVKIAVIDTGVDLNHKDLKNNIWFNKKEIKDGIDNDDNGFVDDVNGWNFAEGNNDLSDDIGHGTHISGIIVKNFPNAKIIPIKYYSNKNKTFSFENSLKALDYAISLNVDIINYSSCGRGYSEKEFKLLKKAKNSGIVVIVASGNKGTDNDKQAMYPSSYKLSNIISVSSLSSNKNLSKTSNFGKNSVEVSYYGEKIKSTLPNNKYGYLTGTSQATAFLSAFVGILKYKNPNILIPEIKTALLKSTDKVENLKDKVNFQGVININKIINYTTTRLVLNK